MNLIEQLGGYDRAKRIGKNVYETGGRLIRYPSKDFDYTDDGGNVCDVELISFKANDLKKALLEYRRSNNIFETGDKVIYPWVGNGICTYNSECIVKTPCIHAADAEVLAGHRLPSIQVLNDHDIPPNTIVLER